MLEQPFILFRDDFSGADVLFDSPREIIVAHTAEQFPAALEAAERARAAGQWLAGFFSYEAGYLLEPKLRPLLPEGRRTPLVCLGVFDGPSDERLPLPHEVGDAIVAYLQGARPADARFREVFAADRAPRRPLTREAVGGIVERACDRAGLDRFGAHRLRHTLGEQMVAAAVPLDAIGQVLRHAMALTTAGYARVDVTALRELAQPWPTFAGAPMGGERS